MSVSFNFKDSKFNLIITPSLRHNKTLVASLGVAILPKVDSARTCLPPPPKRCFSKPTKINDPDKKCNIQRPLAPIILPANSPQVKKETFWSNIAGAELLIKVTDSNIDQVLQNHKAILIMFYGTWCSVCKDVNVEIGKAAKMITPAEGAFGICDAMDNVKAVDKFLITKTPSFKYFRNGVYIADYIGRPLAKDIIFFMKSPPPTINKS